MISPSRRITTFWAKGTITAAVGKPTSKPTSQLRSHAKRKYSVKPTLIAVIVKDMTRLIPRVIINDITVPVNLG
jgi:murein endopeptidase